MKKKILIILFALIPFFVSSQGMYFDIGLGVGGAATKIDGKNASDMFGSSVKETAIEMGLKLGYGPINGTNLYIVGDLSGMGHRFSDSSNYLQFNSYLFGPGVIFYPIPLIQLAGSVGFSWVSNQSDLPVVFYDSKSGFAYNISAAVDLGKGNHGCLLGLRYFASSNTLETSEVKQNSSIVSVFARYAYRHKNK